MGRREIIASLFGLGVAAGLAAVTAALLVQAIPAAPYVLIVGLVIAVICVAGLVLMIRNAPRPAPPLTASEIGVAVAAAVNLDDVTIEKGREFLPDEITPLVLKYKTENRTSLQISVLSKLYSGKHLRVYGTVKGVRELYAKKVQMYLWYGGETLNDPYAGVFVNFDDEHYDQLMAVNMGDRVTVVGQLTSIESISIDHAELEHIYGPQPVEELADSSAGLAKVSLENLSERLGKVAVKLEEDIAQKKRVTRRKSKAGI